MSVPDYTVVTGVDPKHLQQLALTLPTWHLHKPSLFDHPMVIFFDRESGLTENAVWDVVRYLRHPNLTIIAWPPEGIVYEGGDDKWTNAQRHKMLAGYVHVPALFVRTPFWLKLDTDAIAMGQDDWIDPAWFDDGDVFIGPKWPFIKPPDQMVKLDRWVEENSSKSAYLTMLSTRPPLNLIPKPGAGRLGHKRAVSWCAFFDTQFTRACAKAAAETCGPFHTPVPSHDGYMWYMAERSVHPAKRINVKSRGWVVRNNMSTIREVTRKAMNK